MKPRLNYKPIDGLHDGFKFVAVPKPVVSQAGVKSKSKKAVVRPLHDDVDWLTIFFICNVLITIQFILAVGSYSGEGQPPMHGDFEAQRHWMEITYHLPINQWYINGTNNDLLYWGLDYPPLTAYHSYIMGIIAHKINPSWVALHSSRGIETPEHKMFMRISAILPYLCIYLPALFLIVWTTSSRTVSKNALFAVSILYAGLLSMDCGHFQYNSVSLGFFLAAYVALIHNYTIFGSTFFVLSVNYKQMELYHALPIFVFILSRSLKRPLMSRIFESFWALLCVASTVILTFLLIWMPFIKEGTGHVSSVLRRVFPFYRGLYEDKVASVWCSFSFILKLNRFLDTDGQILLSTATVLAASLPSLLILFARPTPKNFRLSLFITSLSFFLFSFQVHEKSILLPAVAALLLLPEFPPAVTFFLHISNTSLFSLCLKDSNQWLFFLFLAYWMLCRTVTPKEGNKTVHTIVDVSCLCSLLICLAEWFISPPVRYPHIFPLINAMYSCCHFLAFLAYFYFNMFAEEYAKWTKKTN